jgi:hypothetical protein
VFSLLVIIALSFFSWQPLLNPGFFVHHDDQQVARLFELGKALMAGQFPVRVVPDLGFGFGYPLFNFYPPFVYYLGEIYHLVGFGYISSIKLVWATALIGSATAMYFLAKKYFGRTGAVVSASFYLYAPYHAVDAYVRGALAELFSFVWLPLILLFSNKPIVAGIFLALLMITHNLIFLPFAGFYILWSRNLKNILLSLLVCFGLTAFFWLPALGEKHFTLVDDLLIKSLASYKIHFVCLSQLWDSLWGYGGSIAGCVDGMSFKLGKLHVLVAALALMVGLIKRSKFIISCFLFLAISVYMTTEYSTFIWDRFPQLWYLQFPWRFLEFAALFSSLLAGSLVIKKPIALILISLLLFFNVKLFVPQTYTNVTDRDLTSDEEIKWRVSGTSFEYLPKGIAVRIRDNGTLGVDIDKETVKVLSQNRYEVVWGDFTPAVVDFDRAGQFVISGSSRLGADLRINIANFPGWKLKINSREAEVRDGNKYKLITVTVPAGQSQIIGRFTDTPVRTLGNLTTILCIIVVSGGLIYHEYRRNKK